MIQRLVVTTLGTLILLGTGFVASSTFRPPSAESREAPDSVFSGERAHDRLVSLLPTDEPRPAGSRGLEAFRQRLLAEIEDLGLPARTDTFDICISDDAQCLLGVNILTDLKGSNELPQIVVTAHIDAARGSPGAGDNAASVATILELARTLGLQTGPQPPVRFVFTDGEEMGGLGARHYFRSESPPSDLVVNVDGSGTSGPSRIVRIGPKASWLVREMIEEARLPLVNSARQSLFRLAGGSTDFTPALEAGRTGVDFTFIGSRWNWHQPTDARDSVSTATLQHHGESVLAAIVAVREAESAHRVEHLFATVAPGVVVTWRQGLPFYALIFFIGCTCAWGLIVQHGLGISRLVTDFGIVVGALSLGLASGYITVKIIGLATAAQPLYPQSTWPWRLGFYVTPWLAVASVGLLTRAFTLGRASALGMTLVFVGLGLALLGDPHVAYPFVLAAGGVSLGVIAMLVMPVRSHGFVASAVGAWVALIFLPFAIIGEITYGLRSTVQIVLPATVAMVGLLPLLGIWQTDRPTRPSD